MVPLAEAWDSGASTWSAQRRKAYANHLGAGAAGTGCWVRAGDGGVRARRLTLASLPSASGGRPAWHLADIPLGGTGAVPSPAISVHHV